MVPDEAVTVLEQRLPCFSQFFQGSLLPFPFSPN